MTTENLKYKITKKISEIEDIELLNKIDSILDSKDNDSELYHLNEVQKNMIKTSKLQLRKGKRLSNEEVIDEIEKWLREK